MPKIPRDLSGKDLCRLLGKLGYTVSRRTGSHIRLSTEGTDPHHITIPDHDPVKIGTLNAIFNDLAARYKMEKNELIKRLIESN